MNRVMYTLACVLALNFAPFLGGGADLCAESCHDQIRPSLVHLHARAQVASGPSASQFVDSYATGFIVSTDGLILTVYHLLSKLGNYVPETVTVEAQIGDTNATVINAPVIDAAFNIDLMLLKIPPGAQPYQAVALGSALDHDLAKPVYTSGFSKEIGYRMHEEKIQARTGPGGYLWTTGFTFKPGESGSPIYNDKGEVLGLVKGDSSGTGFMIPIGFADSLLAQIQLRKIQRSMQDFEVLRKQFDWTGEVITGRREPVIAITYEKRVAGGPQVKSIHLNVTVVGIKDGKREKMPAFPYTCDTLAAPGGESSGTFESRELVERVEGIRSGFAFTRVSQLEVDIVPTLTDGSQLLRKRIVIDY